MWVCRNHPFGVHRLHNPDNGDEFTVTIPLDGKMACDCDAYANNVLRLKHRADEFQATCRHIAQISSLHCGFRSDIVRDWCRMCGTPMIRIEDVIPNWVGKDRKSLVDDLLEMRKEL
jgi:hypothetical protein